MQDLFQRAEWTSKCLYTLFYTGQLSINCKARASVQPTDSGRLAASNVVSPRSSLSPTASIFAPSPHPPPSPPSPLSPLSISSHPILPSSPPSHQAFPHGAIDYPSPGTSDDYDYLHLKEYTHLEYAHPEKGTRLLLFRHTSEDLCAPGGSYQLSDGAGLDGRAWRIFSKGLCNCWDQTQCMCNVRGWRQQHRLALNVACLQKSDRELVGDSCAQRELLEEGINSAKPGNLIPTPTDDQLNFSTEHGVLPWDSNALRKLFQLNKCSHKTTISYIITIKDKITLEPKFRVKIIATYRILDLDVNGSIRDYAQACSGPGKPPDFEACERLICEGMCSLTQKSEVVDVMFMGLIGFWKVKRFPGDIVTLRTWEDQLFFYEGNFFCNIQRRMYSNHPRWGNLPKDFGGDPELSPMQMPHMLPNYPPHLLVPECYCIVRATYR